MHLTSKKLTFPTWPEVPLEKSKDNPGGIHVRNLLKRLLIFLPFFFFQGAIVVLDGGTLWHLQKFLQCIK
jgi:hypothetical protein